MKEEEEEGGGGRGRSRAGAGLSPNCAGESATLYSPSSHGLAPQHPPHPKCPQHGPEQNPRRETTPVPSFAEPQQHPEYQGSAQGLLQAIENPIWARRLCRMHICIQAPCPEASPCWHRGAGGQRGRSSCAPCLFFFLSHPPPGLFIDAVSYSSATNLSSSRVLGQPALSPKQPRVTQHVFHGGISTWHQ